MYYCAYSSQGHVRLTAGRSVAVHVAPPVDVVVLVPVGEESRLQPKVVGVVLLPPRDVEHLVERLDWAERDIGPHAAKAREKGEAQHVRPG